MTALTALIADLNQTLAPEQILTDTNACRPYSGDTSSHRNLPDVVVFPQNEQQVQTVIKLCNQYQIFVTARGYGSGTPGGAVPMLGGLVLSLEKMDQILAINPDDRFIRVQPGITNQAVQDAAREYGFFWPPDPSSAAIASVGGNLAYNAGGPHAVKYGATRENTLGLRAITGAGDLIITGYYTTKGAVGYDLTRLLIGSEGTLAIITEATLKLMPLPETRRTLYAAYADIHTAALAVKTIMAQAITPSALEFLDSKSIGMIQKAPKLPGQNTNPLENLPKKTAALLLIEVDGTAAAITASVKQIQTAAHNEGLIAIVAAQDEAESQQIWDIRKALSPALRYVAPKKINEDIVVPVSQIPTLIAGLAALEKKYDILIVTFGHAGNGNLHVNLMIDPSDPRQKQNATLCLQEVFHLVIQLKGTLSGEHGIGLEKRDFLPLAIDAASLALMRKIKSVFDPKGILNPQKIFPVA